MTDTQLYLAVGLPVFAVLINIVVGVLQHSSVNARFSGIDSRFNNLETRFTNLEACFETLISRVAILDRH